MESKKVKLRILEAAPDDSQAMLALQKIAYRREASLYRNWRIRPLAETVEEIRAQFGDLVILKAVAGGRIVGSVRGHLMRGTCTVVRLMAHPDFQNRGIGTRLRRAIARRFPQAKRFELFTGQKSERNIHLYEKLGYVAFKNQRAPDGVLLVHMRKARTSHMAEAQRDMGEPSIQVRVTSVLVEDARILLVKQRVSAARSWSLPGGKVEGGETLEEALMREMSEETGLRVKVEKLLYLCEKPEANPPLIHITFLVSRRAGRLRTPSGEFDANPIREVRMAPIRELRRYGFSERFGKRALAGFPQAGSYKGNKANIGLD
jgi:ADP-ribose pyrophosphatase YjhB (NUDIX family)/GNAT superfamily N-acetyltransferase